jgi:AraC family transcriptional activator of pobA
MKVAAPLLMIPFREVRHDQPDDVLHYESINVRARLHEWTIPAHRHEGLHQFQILTRGGAQATLDGERLRLSAPLALMVAPGVVHGFTYDRHSAGHQITLPSDVALGLLRGSPVLQAVLGQTLLAQGPALAPAVAACEALFTRLGDEFESSHAGRTEALLAHATLVALWFARHGSSTQATERARAVRDTLLRRYRALIEQNFRRQAGVAFYAERLGVTSDHLSRVCRGTAGCSAQELLHERVLLEARRLLAYTQAQIADIAHELGFEDPAYFSRFFGKLAGQSPSAYRAAIERGLAVRPREAEAR